MSTDLDTRLRDAAHSLHDAADHLEPTELPRDRRPQRTGALVVVLLVVALVAAMTMRRDDDQPSTSTGPSGLPHLIPGAAQDQLLPDGAVDLPTDVRSLGYPERETLAFYGNPDADDPFADADLFVSALQVDIVAEDPTAEPVDVRGTQGGLMEVAGGLELSWGEGDNLLMRLTSHTLDRDQLVAAAEALDIEGGTATLASQPAGVIAPLEEVATATGIGAVGGSAMGGGSLGQAVPTSATGYHVAYHSEDYSRAVSLTMVEGGADELAALRWFGMAGEPGSVAGRSGWVDTGSYQTGASFDGETETPTMEEFSTFVWEEAPGVVAFAQGRGLSPDELEDMVESLRPATEDEWRELNERMVSSLEADAPGNRSSQGGEYGEGSYNIYLKGDGTVCGAVYDDSGATAVTCGTAVVALRADDGTALGVFGIVPPGAVSTREDSRNITFVGADTDDWSGGGNEEDGYVYVAMFEDGELPSAVEFRDENGDVVSTVPVEG